MQVINSERIPQELRDHKQWILWRLDQPGDRKVPYQASGACAKTNDPDTWSDFATVKARYAAGNWSGIGFVFSADDPYTGIDLDGCRDPETGAYAEWAREIIKELNTYAEVSPSQTGVKLWVRGSWPYETGNKVAIPNVEPIGAKKPAIEIYDHLRYFTVTGVRVRGQESIRDCQDVLDSLRARYWAEVPVMHAGHGEWRSQASVIDRARKYIARMDVSISGQDGHTAAFKAACVLCLGFDLSSDDALQLMREWNAGCQPPWSERELLHKVDSAAKQPGERGYLRNVAPQNYNRVDVPEYRPPVAKAAATEKPAAPEIRATTMRDASKKYLEQVTSNKVHLFELGLPDLDYSIGGGVEAGEMIIFAARPSHGKSMAAQQVTHNVTARGIPVLFVSEEMSAVALGKRVLQYVSDVPNEHWKTQAQAVESHIDKHFDTRADCYIIEGCRTADRVATEIRRFVAEKKIGLAIVDYAQLLTGNGKGRYEQITNVSTTLKQVAAECGIPVIVLCQMSRAIERRDTFAPVMSDLKESGQFEQDADVIIFQVWPFRLDPENNKPEEYQLFVCKNRNRPINQPAIKCHFNPGRQKLTYEGGAPSGQPEFSDDVMGAFDGIDGEFR